MRSRLGVHLAGLLCAAGFPLTVSELARLSGRSRARVRALLPAGAEPEGLHHDDQGWSIVDPDAVARVVRNLYAGPMAPGVEYRASVRTRALAPFRAGLRAAADAARTRRSWADALPFLLGDDYPRSMYGRSSERAALIALLTDASRRRAVDAADPDASARQIDAAARHIAGTAATADDLVDLASLLIAARRAVPVDGAPPHGVAPLFAFAGDLERAVQIAAQVRVDPDIERAYVGEAATRAGAARGAAIAADAARAVLGAGAPTGALLRTAQAVAGAALHTESGDSRQLAGLAEELIAAASATEAPVPEVARLSQRLFATARDHERALSATTLATTAAARGRAARADGPSADTTTAEATIAAATIAAAVAHADAIEEASLRAVTFARLACRLRVAGSAGAHALAEAARGAERALADAHDDPAALATIARLLAAVDGPTAADPDVPVVIDAVRAARAARRALALLEEREQLPPRGALRSVAAVATAVTGTAGGEASVDHGVLAAVARAVVDRVAASRHASTLERVTRARAESIACAEAAGALEVAGAPEEALAAARLALETVRRVPATGRARPLAEIAAVLVPSASAALFEVGLDAAEAEAAGAAYRWDGGAAELVGGACASVLLRAGTHTESAGEVFDRTVRAMVRHDYAGGLMRLADRVARRSGDAPWVLRLADAAMRAAHTPDPVLRARARAALSGVDSGTATSELSIRGTARRWFTGGYPLDDLDVLAAVHPASAECVRALIRADLDR